MVETAARPGIDSTHGAPRLSRREDLLTVAFCAWIIVGVGLDGFAHINLRSSIESFFTPWHAVFYSGFAATAIWIGSRVLRAGDVPVGYGMGLVGLVLFAVGGIGDAIWHQVFGIEVNLEALLSPTHTLLFIGLLLVVTSPFRAALSSGEQRAGLPAIASMTLLTCQIAFFFQYLWAPSNLIGFASADTRAPLQQTMGIVSILATTLVLFGPLLVILRSWTPPFGTASGMVVVPAVLIWFVHGAYRTATLLPVLLAGLAADMLIRRAGPRSLVTVVAPVLLLWTALFVIVSASTRVGWSVELWSGSIVLAALVAAGLWYVATRPPLRAESAAR